MTLDELDAALDAMLQAADDDPSLAPGLITVGTDDWITALSACRATCKALHDGLRYRDIVVLIGSTFQAAVLTRAAAGDRGAPYRDPQPLS